MKPKPIGLSRILFAVLVLYIGGGVGETVQYQEIGRRPHRHDFEVEQRTFLFGKLVLVPVLAAVGLKFLALLPIVLSKIALLSVMNFLSTNLNLLVSTLFGMKNFLGKHGLWAQEDTTRHPELEQFADWSSQPWIQPSLRYQYVVDKDPLLGRIETTKAPKVLKVLNGYIPTDFGTSYKMTFDRRSRINDKRHITKAKGQRSNEGAGKYKCYWTSGETDSAEQYNTVIGATGKKEEFINKRRFDVADSRVKQHNYRRKLDAYTGSNKGIGPPVESYASLPNFYDYRSFVNTNGNGNDIGPVYRQVATHGSAEKIDDESGSRDGVGGGSSGGYAQPPFTDDQVKVAENYRDGMMPTIAAQQQQLVYFTKQAESTTAKFKDDGLEN